MLSITQLLYIKIVIFFKAGLNDILNKYFYKRKLK